ncbi:ATP-dependent RNA helicase dbp5 [Labeo rohita]|uniref:ATP-dependent RNA helicase dbp5 n=1 Tax=Labeo rohita TaxID=84645 RepID=A0ABQ8L9W8_LABRO|nr:ATP-dependent RNA helicase dbp5 [Labeo rohita]
MAAVSNGIPVGLLYMRPLQCCLKTKGVLPEGKPALHDQGHAAMPTARCWELLVAVYASDGRVPHQLGSGHEWPPHPRSVERSPSSLALQLPGDAGCVSGPTGEGRGPWHSSVPVSPRCPREISLPTLPVLQGAAVSSEPTPQSSAQKRNGAGELTTPAGVSTAASSAVSCRSSVTGHQTSSSNNTRGQSRETCFLSRLFGSVKTTPKCICLGPTHCRARLSHSIWRSAATFQRGLPTLVGPEQGLVMEQEVDTLLRKAIDVVPSHDRESGFYSRYFIVPKKEGKVAFRSEERIPPHIHPSTQEVPEVRFGGEAYQCRVLPSSLALSPRTFTKCVDAALAPLDSRASAY